MKMNCTSSSRESEFMPALNDCEMPATSLGLQNLNVEVEIDESELGLIVAALQARAGRIASYCPIEPCV